MAAGVNYNNVWAALGKPVSVMGYGDHPGYGHHIGGLGRLGRRLEGRRGRHALEARRRGRDPLQHRLLRGPEVRGLDPLAAPSQMIWGYETTWGSVRPVHQVQAQQLLPKPQGLTWTRRPPTARLLHRLPDADHQVRPPGRPPRPDLGRRRRARRVRHAALRDLGRARRGRGVEPEKGELVKQLGAVDYIDRNEFAGMMRKGGEAGGGEGALQGLARVLEAREGDPRRRARTSCSSTSGRRPSLPRCSRSSRSARS